MSTRKSFVVMGSIVSGVLMMATVTGCGDFGQGSAAESSSSSAVTGSEMERDYRKVTKGTLEAAGTDPKSFRFADDSDFSFEEFDAITPGYCGKTDEGEDEGNYRLTVENSVKYSADEYGAKVDAVWEYWESLGLKPQNIRPSENSRSIAAQTKTGGKVTYSAGKYGEFITSDSPCSVKIVPVIDRDYAPPKSSNEPDY
ncbi:hypothetical protein IDM48_10830 [Rothia amarae]|uniref:Uncharacterized protein n=1 Tax=Rothia amarae TaxID=169480 RepID=A0A7H2BJH9_9MICC|nr:hypothetical protein [Rothia amarae]QNV39825.1 hypothetical protein IDM48_10830 [Rothia amarae]